VIWAALQGGSNDDSYQRESLRSPFLANRSSDTFGTPATPVAGAGRSNCSYQPLFCPQAGVLSMSVSRSMKAGPVRRFRLGLAAFALTIATLTAGTGAQPAQSPTGSEGYPNFDIRVDKESASAPQLGYLERVSTPTAAFAADRVAQARENGIARLKGADGAIAVEQHPSLGVPEVVSAMPGGGFLSGPSDDRVSTLRAFLSAHADAYGVSAPQVQGLDLVADYVNPAGNMAWVELQQTLNGVPVFQGTIRGGFTAKGELARTTGALATAIDGASLATAPLLSARQAIAIAAANVGWAVNEGALVDKGEDGAGHSTFASADLADDAKAWLLYFPIKPSLARLVWAVEVWGNPIAYLMLVDGEDGTVLFRKSLTGFQTQAATYSVYTSDNPAPLSPMTGLPGSNTQGVMASRTLVTRIGNEAPNTFNNNGWITDGGNTTDGNNVEAGVDLVAPNGVDAPTTGSPARVFNFAYNPSPGSPPPGDAPTDAAYRNGEVTNLFYWTNVFHDRAYTLGFTEAAGNFQHANFGRGGVEGDRLSVEAQDSSGTNNANFTTVADGGRGRMQMFVWTGTTPDRGGALDQEVVLHELTHGLSSRLHGNASGLNTNLSRGLSEGWSDFYARSLLATADEDVNGIYTIGGWATHLLQPGFTDNYYYGIRRFPYAVKTNLGPNGKPHSPLTFADIDPAQINLTDGAFPRGPIGVAAADGIHNIGEVWCVALLEVRARFITRLGFATGNQRILQFVTDGMKLDPLSPTLLQARDSILAAANAGGGTATDIADIWAGFATRGMGVLASQSGSAVTESFLTPSDPIPSFSIGDVAIAEGQSGTTTAAFSVTLANPSTVEHRVSFATASGSATSPELTFTSTAPLTIPAAGTSGPATPYPATLNLVGLTGTVANVALRLDSLTHTFPGDLDVLLVGPGGQKAMVMSDIGGGTDVSGITLTFQDGAPAPPSTLVTGTFAPTDATPGDAMAAPAPAGPYTSALSTFNGTNPNGAWSLYVVDDEGGDVGSLASFSLVIMTTGTSDYAPSSGQLIFPAGTTTQPVNIAVNGDAIVEANETFVVNLTNPINAVVGDPQAVGTILNDDGTVPVAAGDAYVTIVDTPLVTPGPGVLANDNPSGGGALSALLMTSVAHGSLTLNADGSFAYTPAPAYTGTDSFTYLAVNGLGVSNVVTVTLTVNVITGPQPPSGLYVSSMVGNVATFRFTPPAVGSTPTGYVLEGGVSPGEVLGSVPTGSTAPIFTIALPSGAFFLRARTLVGADQSAPSNEVHVFVNTPVAPSAPANLLGLVDGGNVALAWRNTFAGGAPTSLILDVTGSLSGSIPLALIDNLAVSGVPAGTYTLSFRAANGAGISGPSNAVTLTIPSACSGVPLTPTNFLAYKAGGILSLVWDPAAGGPAPTSFLLNVTGSFVGSFPLPGRGVSASAPPGTYSFTLQGVNACGAGAPTPVQTLTVP
jgi:subtilisin-like proprotein convertase family protein